MEISVKTDKGDRKIKLRAPKGRDTKKGLKLLLNTQKPGGGQLVELNKYMDHVDNMVIMYTDLTEEEYGDLETGEQAKISDFYYKKVRERIDFLMSSLRQESSAPKEKTV